MKAPRGWRSDELLQLGAPSWVRIPSLRRLVSPLTIVRVWEIFSARLSTIWKILDSLDCRYCVELLWLEFWCAKAIFIASFKSLIILSTLSAFASFDESDMMDGPYSSPGCGCTIEEFSTNDFSDPISSVIFEKKASILLSSVFWELYCSLLSWDELNTWEKEGSSDASRYTTPISENCSSNPFRAEGGSEGAGSSRFSSSIWDSTPERNAANYDYNYFTSSFKLSTVEKVLVSEAITRSSATDD